MLLNCLKCKTDTESKNPRISKTSNGGTLLLSKHAVFNSDLSFIIYQNVSFI